MIRGRGTTIAGATTGADSSCTSITCGANERVSGHACVGCPAQLAHAGMPEQARVSLDAVIQTLRQTAEDMSDKYKETSQGGLATNVSVRFTEC
mgnify:CR=1 FL=1